MGIDPCFVGEEVFYVENNNLIVGMVLVVAVVGLFVMIGGSSSNDFAGQAIGDKCLSDKSCDDGEVCVDNMCVLAGKESESSIDRTARADVRVVERRVRNNEILLVKDKLRDDKENTVSAPGVGYECADNSDCVSDEFCNDLNRCEAGLPDLVPNPDTASIFLDGTVYLISGIVSGFDLNSYDVLSGIKNVGPVGIVGPIKGLCDFWQGPSFWQDPLTYPNFFGDTGNSDHMVGSTLGTNQIFSGETFVWPSYHVPNGPGVFNFLQDLYDTGSAEFSFYCQADLQNRIVESNEGNNNNAYTKTASLSDQSLTFVDVECVEDSHCGLRQTCGIITHICV